jgi:hypothetical protein
MILTCVLSFCSVFLEVPTQIYQSNVSAAFYYSKIFHRYR